MEKIIPFEGGEMRKYNHFRSPVFHLIMDGLNREDYRYYIIAPEGMLEADERLIDILRSQEKELIPDGDKKFKLKGQLWEGMLYIISGEPIFKYKETTHVHKLSPLIKQDMYPRIETIPSYKGKKWSVQVYKYNKLESSDKSVPGPFVAHYLHENSGGQYEVTGDTKEDLVANLREELADQRHEISVSPSKIKKALKSFYYNPYNLWYSFDTVYDMKRLPVEKNLVKNIKNTKCVIECAHKSSYNISFVKLYMTIPSLNIEDYRRLMMQIETAIIPAFRDRQYVLARNGDKDDPLFGKVCEHIGSLPCTYEVRGKKGFKTQYIKATYADYMDMGEVFTLGEAHELSRRLVSV